MGNLTYTPLFTLPHIMNETFLIQQAHVVLPHQIIQGDVLLKSGKIAQISRSIPPDTSDKIIRAEGKYLLPGFIDIHNHGALGFDFSLGNYEPEFHQFANSESVYKQGLIDTLGYFLKKGTTTLFPTSLAAALDDLVNSFREIYRFSKSDHLYSKIIGGINLEGTFIKDPAYAGAQNPEYFFSPDPATFDLLNEAAGHLIQIVNLPPEHGAASLDLVQKLTHQGICVAGGHTGAYAEEFEAYVQAGLRLAVHFLNGPSRSFTKPFQNGGAVEEMLRNDQVSLEIITDGYHVHPAYVRDSIARKGFDKIIIITDSLFVNGLLHLSEFQISGIRGELSENREYLQVQGKADTLFGSVLTMDRAFANMLNWLIQDMEGIWHRKHEALSLEEGLIRTSQMASGNPAKLMNIDQETGSIAIGKRANLILGEIQSDKQKEGYGLSKTYSLKIDKVFLDGILS